VDIDALAKLAGVSLAPAATAHLKTCCDNVTVIGKMKAALFKITANEPSSRIL
jgi:hypothetical protein